MRTQLGTPLRILAFALLTGTLAAAAQPAVTTAPTADKRLPLPAPAAITAAEKLIREIYKRDFANARGRAAFSATLLKTAGETADDPAAKFVLLREARDQIALAGEAAAAIAVADVLADTFAVDRSDAQLDGLRKAWTAGPVNGPVATHFIDLALAQGNKAAARGDFDGAAKFETFATEAARRVGDNNAFTRIRAWGRAIKDAKTDADAHAAAAPKLKADPKDPAANADAARWLCARLGDWDAGLKHLAAANQPALSDLATRDLANPASAADRLALADAWHAQSAAPALAETPWAAAARDRAAHWYAKSIEAGLAGLPRAVAEKRIAAATEARNAQPRLALPPTPQP